MTTPSHPDERLPWVEGDNDPDYVVLPPDPEVLEMERRRNAEQIAKWDAAAREQPFWEKGPRPTDFRLQFSIKDLLALTTVVAFALAVVRTVDSVFTGIMIVTMGVLAWLQFRIVLAEKSANRASAEERGESLPTPQVEWREFAREFYRYSVADLLIATTVTAFVLALLRWLPPIYAAGVLGPWVFGGIFAYLMGVRPSRRWWLVWFLVCIAYVAVTVFAAVAD